MKTIVLVILVCYVSVAFAIGEAIEPDSSEGAQRVTNTWDGSSSTDWHTPANWSLNRVPLSTDDVVIPTLLWNYPVISGNATCASLIMYSSSRTCLTITTGYLSVLGNCTISSTFEITGITGELYVQGNLTFGENADAYMTADAWLFVRGNLTVENGASVNFSAGTVKFTQSGNSNLLVNTLATFHNLIIGKDDSYGVTYLSSSEEGFRVEGSLTVETGSYFTNSSLETIVILGDLAVEPGASITHTGSGRIKFEGGGNSILDLAGSGSYLYSLDIYKATGVSVTLHSNLDLRGNLSIYSGIFSVAWEYLPGSFNYYDINIRKSWFRSPGPGEAVFNAAIGSSATVTFNNANLQYVDNTDFNHIVASGAYDIVISSTVTCAKYTWVSGGIFLNNYATFTAYDLTQNGIYGNFTANPGSVFNLYQDATQYPDLNANLINYGGTFNFYGGSSDSYWAYDANVSIEMSSGVIDFKDRGIVFWSGNALGLNIEGGTIRTVGSIWDYRGNLDFGACNVELYGPGQVTLSLMYNTPVFNLDINKSGTRDAAWQPPQPRQIDSRPPDPPDQRINEVLTQSDAQVLNDLNVNAGTLKLGSYTVQVYRFLNVYASLQLVTGSVLDVQQDVTWYGTTPIVIDQGSIYCGGNWGFMLNSSVNLTGSTVYLDSNSGASIINVSLNSYFGNLVIASGSTTPVTTTYQHPPSYILNINGSLIVNTQNTLDLNDGVCQVQDNVTVNAGGRIIAGDDRNFTINGNMSLNGRLETGTSVVTLHGNLTTGSQGFLDIDGGQFISDTAWTPVPVELNCGVNVNLGILEFTHRSLRINYHPSRNFSQSTLIVGGSFTASSSGGYQPEGGYLYLTGDSSGYLDISNGNWTPNLYLAKAGAAYYVTLNAPLVVKGNMSIMSGKLFAAGYGITVAGNWTNNAGSDMFVPQGCTVTFNGPVDQLVYGITGFFNLVNQNPGNELRFYGRTTVAGTLTVNNLITFHLPANLNFVDNASSSSALCFINPYTSTIASYAPGGFLGSYSDGNHVIINHVDCDAGIPGDLTAYGGHLEFHLSPLYDAGLCGTINISQGGMIDIYGGADDVTLGGIGHTTLILQDGELSARSNGIRFPLNDYECNFLISGGWIRSFGDWLDYRGGFCPTAGTVVLAGPRDAVVNVHPTSWFWELVVNKEDDRTTMESAGYQSAMTRNANLVLNTCQIKGPFIIECANQVVLGGQVSVLNSSSVIVYFAPVRLNHQLLACSGSVDVYGRLILDAGAELRVGNNLEIFEGGWLESVGAATQPALITRYGSSAYAFNVNAGGTIAAAHTVFSGMLVQGVNVHSGATVDPVHSFNYCSYLSGVPGGTLLTMNTADHVVIQGAAFPENTWGGASNVAKTVNQGQLAFAAADGAFSGQAFEFDPFGRVYWFEDNSLTGEVEITEAPDGTGMLLNWNCVPNTVYHIYRSDNPDGPFTEIAWLIPSGSTATWEDPVSGDYYFYRISCDLP